MVSAPGTAGEGNPGTPASAANAAAATANAANGSPGAMGGGYSAGGLGFGGMNPMMLLKLLGYDGAMLGGLTPMQKFGRDTGMPATPQSITNYAMRQLFQGLQPQQAPVAAPVAAPKPMVNYATPAQPSPVYSPNFSAGGPQMQMAQQALSRRFGLGLPVGINRN